MQEAELQTLGVGYVVRLPAGIVIGIPDVRGSVATLANSVVVYVAQNLYGGSFSCFDAGGNYYIVGYDEKVQVVCHIKDLIAQFSKEA